MFVLTWYVPCFVKVVVQPYQIFFPIGVLYGIWGTFLWILHALGWIAYPGIMHAGLMITGFLFSFALGFLMTAVPRFTGARFASKNELIFATGLSLISFAGIYPAVFSLIILIFIAIFFLSRFRERIYTPPVHFIFIPLGIIIGILGSILIINDSPVGRVFLYQGTMLCFVLGVGGKLVTALLGWGALPTTQFESLGIKKKSKLPPWNVLIPFILLLLGFALEFSDLLAFGRVLRAIAGFWVGIAAWKIHKLPAQPGRLSMWLWISCWGLVTGLWIYALVPNMGIHGMHFTFISGFGLMTLMIASRVTLAHGGYDLTLELKSKTLLWTSSLVILSAITRVIAPYSLTYFNHLAYASATWIVAMVIWVIPFLPRIIFHSSQRNMEHATKGEC